MDVPSAPATHLSAGWKLDRGQRDDLLALYPPRYATPVADHVTLIANRAGEDELPAPVASARIIGRADDGCGVEAMVVEINGSTTRPDGGTWHITWSLGEGRKARESNDVILERGFDPLDGGEIILTPACW